MSITGHKKVELTIDNILKKISAYDIFKYYMPVNNWKINQVTHSPFRKDSAPSFIIGNKGGYLGYIDFGISEKKEDCFDFVKRLLHLTSLNDVLQTIDKDFNLGLSLIVTDKPTLVRDYKQPEEEGKKYAHIQVITRKFTKEELHYWSEYYQDIEDLKREEIYGVEKVFLNRSLFTMNPLELRFGYFYNGFWKIYRPFADKKKKWVPNNVPLTYLEGKEDIRNSKIAIITKSKKDKMVLQKVYPHVCATQNESIACFSEHNIEYIKSVSDRQILAYDSDNAGVNASLDVTKQFDFGYCNVPKLYLGEGIKDWALLGKVHGLKAIEDVLKEKEIL